MAISKAEKQQLAQLSQNRSKSNQENKGLIQGITPATFINIGEVVIILGAAITVDAIDALDLTGVGAIIARLIDIPTLGALWLWRILKHQPGPKKDPTFLLLSAFLIELSPAGMIPTWTLFVAYVYFRDSKLARTVVGGAMRTSQTTKAIRRKIKK